MDRREALYLNEVRDALGACNVVGPIVWLAFLYFDVKLASENLTAIVLLRIGAVPLFWLFSYLATRSHGIFGIVRGSIVINLSFSVVIATMILADGALAQVYWRGFDICLLYFTIFLPPAPKVILAQAAISYGIASSIHIYSGVPWDNVVMNLSFSVSVVFAAVLACVLRDKHIRLQVEREKILEDKNKLLKSVFHVSTEIVDLDELPGAIEHSLQTGKTMIKLDLKAIISSESGETIGSYGNKEIDEETGYSVSVLLLSQSKSYRKLTVSTSKDPIPSEREVLGYLTEELRSLIRKTVLSTMKIEAAKIDQATGLYTKSYFSDYKKLVLAPKTEEWSVINCDINDLKRLNDNYGHEFGDEMILVAIDIIQNNTGNMGKVFKFGGDEFLVIIDGPIQIANSVKKAIRREIELFSTEKNGDPIQISMSMGVASSREGPMQKVFDLADERQYEDKREVKKRLGITAYRSHDHVS